MGVANPFHAKHPPSEQDAAAAAASGTAAAADERVRRESWFKHLLSRPEFAALAGTVMVFLVFGLAAGNSGMFNLDGVMNWSQVAAYLGIIAVGACLLMIAGEFDLSIGSMIGFSGMMVALPTMYFHWPIALSIVFAFAGSMLLGALNGYLVMRTRLALLHRHAGLPVYSARPHARALGDVCRPHHHLRCRRRRRARTGSRIPCSRASRSRACSSGSDISVSSSCSTTACRSCRGFRKSFCGGSRLPQSAHSSSPRPAFGNWIFAVGGDANAAKNVGVPVRRVKISLFVLTAFCSCLYSVLQVCDIGSAAADRGLQAEFEAIIAAVIGGTLLTGGYGSVVGASFGALIFGVVQIGITYTNIDSDWFRVFLGAMLLFAVLFNHYVRSRVAAAR